MKNEIIKVHLDIDIQPIIFAPANPHPQKNTTHPCPNRQLSTVNRPLGVAAQPRALSLVERGSDVGQVSRSDSVRVLRE